ncbi:MAG: adenylosuccinate lyase [Bacteroidetes bacterium GWE2_29_8]|nr:MAG: adenylosuccinate lyase [Bacteroidetes bacterium GWE2_29_8]OFY17399.1 MAG: adenylosuccinate lyase [Bacteroidetes bacterium GWF2_29_10]
MDNFELYAISPIDGRYWKGVESLKNYFSEYALIRYRVLVEVEYFIALTAAQLPNLKDIDKSDIETKLRNIYINFEESSALRIKEIERTTNHDVKAVEYFLREEFEKIGIAQFNEFIHFGLTSQDINNTAVPMSLKDAIENVYEPLFNELLNRIEQLAKEWDKIPMLARTHGQPASPTRLGKEIYVFYERLQKQKEYLKAIPFSAKFGGATGNFNAHYAAFPNNDWIDFANNFVNKTLKLTRTRTTTQIEHYDNLAALFDAMKRINNIIVDMNRDFWHYISIDYFKQKINKDEVGSSAMPHKVNPIDFENSEGNLGIANALFEHLSAKLPISRLQRDLTDSTVLRNVGVPIAHSIIAFKSTLRGLNKLIINNKKIENDLNDNWAVIAEAIQTILRSVNYPDPYNALKQLTRNNEKIDATSLQTFINNLDVEESVKQKLLKITPFNYVGK